MRNVYLKQYVNVLEAHYEKQKALNKQIEENNKKFSPEYAEKENKLVRAEQEKAFEEAIALITGIFDKVKELLAYGSFLNVEDLTADRIIFESGFELTAQDIKAYLERYADNYTMKRYIADWVKKQPKPEQYGIVNFALPSDQVLVYKQFAEKAVYVAKCIYLNKPIMQDPIEIKTFDDPIMCADELAVIGTGEELAGFKNKRIPEAQLHIFDGVKLVPSVVQGVEGMLYTVM